MTQIEERVDALVKRIESLEYENAELRGQLEDRPSSQPTESRRFGRRNLLRLGGAAAAVSAGSVLLRPGVAGAASGDFLKIGNSNDAGTDPTNLLSTSPESTLSLENSAGGATVRALNSGAGMALDVHTSNAANTLTALNVTDDGSGGAIFAEVTSDSVLSPAVFAIVDSLTAAVAVVEAENDGLGTGVFAHIENSGSTAAATRSATIGKGNAVLATVSNAASTASVVKGSTNGKGAGVEGVSSAGIGGRFAGKTAQVYLVPSSASSHPSSGSRGQLFVDKYGRLWFCKGGTSWKQLA